MILLNGHTLQARDRFRAESMSLSIEERNTTATLTVGPDAPEIGINDWLKDDTEPGMGIVWRVKNVRRQIETDTRTISLEHVIQVLRDSLIFGEVKADGMGGGGGSCTARQAIAYALGRQAGNIWRLGDVQVNPSNPYAFNGDSVYSAIETVTGSLDGVQWEYDLSSLPFTLHIRREPTGFDSEMRMSRNISSLSIQIDRSRMYTRHYPTGKNNLHLSGVGYTSRNEATWGVVCRTETDGSIETEAALRAWSLSRLNKHCEPTVTVTVGGIDLSRDTGEPLDRITVGRKCRLPLPEYGTTMTEKVTKISWADKVKEPDRFTVTMANLQEDVARILSSQIASSSRGGRTAQKKAEEDHAWFVDTTEHVAMVAEAVAGEGAAEDWSRVASIVVDGEGVHQRVTKTEGELVTHQTAIEANEKAIGIEAKSRADADTELSGRIDVTDRNVTIEVKARKDGDDALSGRLDVTERAITAEVTNREAGDRALRGALIVEAGKASLVAELTDDRPIIAFDSSADFPAVGDTSIIYLDNTARMYYEWTGSRYKIVNPGAVIKASAITTAINEAGESETHIDSDHVYIGNQTSTTVINGKVNTRDFTAVKATVDNLTGLTIKENYVGASLVTGTTVTAVNTFTHAGDTIWKRGLKWTLTGDLIATIHAVGTDATSIILNHSHAMTVDASGNVTIGDAQVTTGNFNIADTAFYISGVSAARTDGWDLARGYVAPPEAQTANAYMDFGVPAINYNDSSSYRFTVTEDGSYAYIKNALNQTVARTPLSGTYDQGKHDGWDLARGYVDPPDEQTSNAYMDFGVPAVSYDSSSSYRYTVSVDNDYAYIKNAANRVVARVRNVKTTQHNNCADGLTKSGAYNVVYVPDDTGTTISIKVKNISASGRYWYYRGSEQNLFTAYT